MTTDPISKSRLASVPEALSGPLFVAARRRSLKAGEVLFAGGDAGDGCYLLDRGLLRVTVTSSWGEERTIAILGPGAVVGELSMIDGRPRSASVVALNDCLLRFTSGDAFAKCMATHPEAYQALVAILAFRLRQADEGLAATTFLSVKGRVARALVELAEGPRLITTIEGATPDELVLDMAVTAVFRPLDPDEPDGAHLTVFTPTRLR